MREILFRWKMKFTSTNLPKGIWVYDDIFNLLYGVTARRYNGFVEIIPETIGQYTGLTYKAGTRAFEHDCIKQRNGDAIGVIRYGKYHNAFDGDNVPHHVGFFVDWVSGEDKDIRRKDLIYWINRVENIGNIHDNPELLKGER